MSNKDTSPNRLLASKNLSGSNEKQFDSYEFPAGILISKKKYKHPESKKKSTFYYFNNQLDHALAHYFAQLKIIKTNVNKFLTDPLMALVIKKLFYKNADKWIKKLLRIL